MPETRVILNPNAGRGYGATIRPDIERHLARLGVSYDLVETTHTGHAIELAREAVLSGFGTIVAVGGDGTTNEVVNGMMSASPQRPAGILACIPAGSGNDFAVMNGTATNLEVACQAIATGKTQVIDVGRVVLDDTVERYFDNAVGMGFDALVVLATRQIKRLRGMAMYLPAVLKTIFVTMRIPTVELTIDDETRTMRPLMVVACNGPREGSTFHLTPGALYDDGKLDMLLADEVSKLEMLALLPRFMKGTHLNHPAISTVRAERVSMRSTDPLYVHVDGEILNDHSHLVEIQVLPGALRMISSF